MPLVSNALKSQIIAGRTAVGAVVDPKVKAATSSLPPEAMATAGQKAWQAALTSVYANLDSILASSVSAYLAGMIVTYGGVPSIAIFPPPVFNFSATATSDGAIIDTKAKAVTSALPPSATATAGEKVWTQAFLQIYTTLITVAATAISTSLQAGTSIVQPPAAVAAGVPGPGVVAAPVPALVLPSVWSSALLSVQLTSAFSSLASNSGPIVDASIKAKTSTLPPSAASTAGTIVWEEFTKYLFNEIATVLSSVVHTFVLTGNGIVFNIPPGTSLITTIPPSFTGTSTVPQPATIS